MIVVVGPRNNKETMKEASGGMFSNEFILIVS